MPFTPTAVQDAWAKLASAPAAAKALRTDLTGKLDQLNNDARWSTAHRAETARQLREDTAARAATLRREVAEAHQTLRAQRPAEPADASTLLVAEQRQGRAWARLRPLLDAGRPLGDVLSDAEREQDVDALRALRSELPAWAAAQRDYSSALPGESHAQDVARTADALRERVDIAMAGLPEGADRTAARCRLHAAAWKPVADAHLDAVDHQARAAETGTELASALTVHYAEAKAQRLTAAMDAQGTMAGAS